MRNQRRKRNAPIATLIRNYVNKKSGKVSASRDEIKRRFDHLDWKDQKKILNAFLDACTSDREWAFTKLLDYWDESFEPKVKELWETYHEYRCSWSVIRYFPLDYIKAHMDEFTDERDYYFICLRLAQDKTFVIDRSKLSDIDYLSLLYHTNRFITEDDARDTLFRVVHDCCLADTFMTRLERLGEGKYREVISPLNFREVNLAFYYVLKLQQYEVLASFKDWVGTVEETIYNSPEFKAIDKNAIDNDYEYDRRRVEIAKIYAYEALNEKYKLSSDPGIEQIRKSFEQSVEWGRHYREHMTDGVQTPLLDNDEFHTDPFPF